MPALSVMGGYGLAAILSSFQAAELCENLPVIYILA